MKYILMTRGEIVFMALVMAMFILNDISEMLIYPGRFEFWVYWTTWAILIAQIYIVQRIFRIVFWFLYGDKRG